MVGRDLHGPEIHGGAGGQGSFVVQVSQARLLHRLHPQPEVFEQRLERQRRARGGALHVGGGEVAVVGPPVHDQARAVVVEIARGQAAQAEQRQVAGQRHLHGLECGEEDVGVHLAVEDLRRLLQAVGQREAEEGGEGVVGGRADVVPRSPGAVRPLLHHQQKLADGRLDVLHALLQPAPVVVEEVAVEHHFQPPGLQAGHPVGLSGQQRHPPLPVVHEGPGGQRVVVGLQRHVLVRAAPDELQPVLVREELGGLREAQVRPHAQDHLAVPQRLDVQLVAHVRGGGEQRRVAVEGEGLDDVRVEDDGQLHHHGALHDPQDGRVADERLGAAGRAEEVGATALGAVDLQLHVQHGDVARGQVLKVQHPPALGVHAEAHLLVLDRHGLRPLRLRLGLREERLRGHDQRLRVEDGQPRRVGRPGHRPVREEDEGQRGQGRQVGHEHHLEEVRLDAGELLLPDGVDLAGDDLPQVVLDVELVGVHQDMHGLLAVLRQGVVHEDPESALGDLQLDLPRGLVVAVADGLRVEDVRSLHLALGDEGLQRHLGDRLGAGVGGHQLRLEVDDDEVLGGAGDGVVVQELALGAVGRLHEGGQVEELLLHLPTPPLVQGVGQGHGHVGSLNHALHLWRGHK